MKYICEHHIPNDHVENRVYTLSSNDKADYIVSALNRNGIDVQMISPSMSSNKTGFYKKREDKINSHFSILSASTFGASTAIIKKVQKIYALIWLTWYLLKNCDRNEWIVVYHSVFYAIPLLIAKKIKKIKILNEVEELFYELDLGTSYWRIRLERKIIDKSDAYIFASKQLEKKCNKSKRPYVIANGNYTCADIRTNRSNDKIKLVYAGLIEKGKVAFKSVEIAKFLSDKYQINVIGYGKEQDIIELKELIDKINLTSQCKVRFDGTKRGKEYEIYLQKCHIGLCLLTNNPIFQSACFPSKITSYIANGLHVVTTKNEVIMNSGFASAISFVEDDDPKSFAEVINNIDNNRMVDSRYLIKKLDETFVNELSEII